MIVMSNGETFEASTTEKGEIHLKGSNGYDQYGTGIQADINGKLMIRQNHKWIRVSEAYVRSIEVN